MRVGTFRARLALLVGASGVLPLVIFGALAALAASRSLTRSVVHGNRLAAEQLADRIDSHVENYVAILRSIREALGRDVALSPDQTNAILGDQRLAFPVLDHLVVCRLDGSLLASGEPMAVSQPCAPTDPALTLRAASDVYRSDVRLTDDLHPEVTLAVPLVALGKVDGVLRADVDLTGLWDLIDSVAIGEHGRARLASRSGVQIAIGDPRLRYEVFRSQPDEATALIARVDRGITTDLTYHNGVGERVLGVGVPVPNLGWAVLVEQPTAEAFLPVRWLWRGMIAGAALFGFLGVIVGLLVARTLVRPVDSLRRQASAIGAGDLAAAPLPRGPAELRDLAQSMNDMAAALDRLQERMRRDERMNVLARTASGLVHDLKNSVVGLVTRSEGFLVQPDNAALRAGVVKAVADSRRNIDGLFDDLRRAVRNEPIVLVPMTVDLAAMGEQIFADFSVQLREGVTLERDIRPCTLTADPKLLHRVLTNLVKNALEAQAARPPGTVRLTVEPGDGPGGARVAVSDEGVGIEARRIPDLFTALQTTKTKGFGVGLASVKKIVDEHGGRIEVTSELGKGTRFTVHLPAEPPQITRLRADQAARSAGLSPQA